MRKLFIFIVVLFSTIASAEEYYISGHFGGNLANSTDSTVSKYESSQFDFDIGGSFLIAYGINLSRPNMRTEIELGYQKSDIEKSNNKKVSRGFISAISLMVNEYYDFHNRTLFTPYVTLGIGGARVELDDYEISEYKGKDDILAFSAGFGVEYALKDNMSLDVRYKYFMTDDSKFSNSSCEYDLHSILFGIKVNF